MAVRNVRLDDIDQLHALFANWSGRFEQISHGPFEANLQVVQCRLLRGIEITANQRVRLRGSDNADRISVFESSVGNAASLWRGRRLTPGQFLVHGLDDESDHCSGRKTSVRGFSLDHTRLEEAARSLTAREDLAVTRVWHVLSPGPDRTADLHVALERFMCESAADPAILDSPEGHRLEDDCVRALVESMFAKTDSPAIPPPPVRARIVRRAEEYMRSRLGESIGAVDLCREVGTSDRTLRLAFRERFGVGPMAYLQCIRLNAVRARLKADPEVTVAAAAHEFGFHHLGNFAANFRRLFGEPPSAIPRRN